MTLIDARELSDGATLDGELCVIGAGAAGIVVASELARRGHDVILLEAGGTAPNEETQALHDLESVGQPVRDNFMARARYYGGTCNVWAGRSMLLSPFDLAPRSWVPESGWPLAPGELDRWYGAAAELLRLPPTERFDRDGYAERWSETEARLFDGDPFQATVSLWGKRPMRFGPAYRRELERSPRVRLVLHANVTELVPGGSEGSGARVDRVRASTLTGRRFTVRARRFVLAGGGLENARLLLVSKGAGEHGLGNEHDLVGRYFMDHPRAVFGRVRLARPASLPWLKGIPIREGKAQLGIGPTQAVQERERLLNHYVTFEAEYSAYAEASYGVFVRTMKILLRRGHAGSRSLRGAKLAHVPNLIYLLTPGELMPHPLYRALHAARRARASFGRAQPEHRIVVYYCEQPPLRESRVTLGDERDALGTPRLVLDWRLGDAVTESVHRIQDLLGRELAERGVGTLEPGTGEPAYTDASHHMGTTRMSLDAEDGVVDTDCRVHGVENLYVASSSVFPCAGHANPTFTIVALALRLAEHLGERTSA